MILGTLKEDYFAISFVISCVQISQVSSARVVSPPPFTRATFTVKNENKIKNVGGKKRLLPNTVCTGKPRHIL